MRLATTVCVVALLGACGPDGAGLSEDAGATDVADTPDAAERDTMPDTTADDAADDATPDVVPPDASDALGDSSDADAFDVAPDAAPALLAVIGAERYAIVGEPYLLDGSASIGAADYRWTLPDGSFSGDFGATPTWELTFDTPGRYTVQLAVRDGLGDSDRESAVITATYAPVFEPRQSSAITTVPDRDAVLAVAEDNDEVALVSFAGGTFAVERYIPVCDRPRTVSALADRFAVACQNDDRVMVLDYDGNTLADVTLRYGTRPFGVVLDDVGVWVSGQGTGRLYRLEPVDGGWSVVRDFAAITDARGVAQIPDGRIAVTRWRSADDAGRIVLIDGGSGERETLTLPYSDRLASDGESGGVPTYLTQLLVSPNGRDAVYPAQQANFGQGVYRNGHELTFETTVRAILGIVDLGAMTELSDERKLFDNRGLGYAGVFSSRGDFVYVAMHGAGTVERFDLLGRNQSGAILGVGVGLDGVALSDDDRYLFVNAQLSREVVVYDVRSFATAPTPLVRLPLYSSEPLNAELLLGKQLFNESFDPRLSRDQYIACSHCHLDAESDGRTWDFTDRGEGLRNTISLLGHGEGEWGPIHWSGNFNEIQDFEHDIRGPFGGSGLMSDESFFSGGRDHPLQTRKAGQSADLDALAMYVSSLMTVPRSPWRNPDGSLTEAAVRGRAVFERAEVGCMDCHYGDRFTDSGWIGFGVPLLHDVGTLTASSGQRLHGDLTGLDTPTLRELWNSWPYLHDGRAQTLGEVFTSFNPGDEHGVTSGLTSDELADLEVFLLSL
jgi:hypothetical protein